MLRILVISTAIAWSGFAFSLEKSPPKEQPTKDTKQSKIEKIGTAQRPFIITIKPTEADEIEAKAAKDEASKKSDNDRDLVYWTRIMAALAGLQLLALGLHAFIFRTQYKAMRESIESTERTERASLFVGKIEPAIFPIAPEHKIYPGGKDAPWPRIHYSFVNFGRSAAVVKRVRMRLILEKLLPPQPNYQDAVTQLGENVVNNGASTQPNREVFERHLTAEEIKEVQSGVKKFFLFGHTHYLDIYGALHTYAFCFEFLPERNSVAVTGGDAYNYRRVNKNPDESVDG